MDLLKPDLHLKISNLQIDQTVTKSGAIIREFSIGQTVIARNYTDSTKWVPDIIERFRSLIITTLHALVSGEELRCFWPVANTL